MKKEGDDHMVNANLGPEYDLAQRLSTMERQIMELQHRDVLINASIGQGGITVDGGKILITNGGSIEVDGTGIITLPTGTLSANHVQGTTDVTAPTVNATTVGTTDVNSTGTATLTQIYSTTVYNQFVGSGAYKYLYVNVSGQFGYVPSSRRYKQDIQTAPSAAEAMLAMRIVTFRYIQAVQELGDAAAVEWGVIAEEMHDLGLTWLVDYDEHGKPEGVKHERLVLAVIPVVQDHEARLRSAGL